MPLFGQVNYYVSPSGNNGDSGDLLNPWRTVQFGLDQLVAFDTLNLMTGIFNEKLVIHSSNITIRILQKER